MIRTILQNHLNADVAVTALLTTYPFTDGTPAPAIFTGQHVPDNASYPCLWIPKPTPVTGGTRGNKGGGVNVNVNVLDDKETSDLDLDALAEAVWDSLDRADLDTLMVAAGYEFHGCVADMPASNTGPDQFPSYVVKCMVWFTQADA